MVKSGILQTILPLALNESMGYFEMLQFLDRESSGGCMQASQPSCVGSFTGYLHGSSVGWWLPSINEISASDSDLYAIPHDLVYNRTLRLQTTHIGVLSGNSFLVSMYIARGCHSNHNRTFGKHT